MHSLYSQQHVSMLLTHPEASQAGITTGICHQPLQTAQVDASVAGGINRPSSSHSQSGLDGVHATCNSAAVPSSALSCLVPNYGS